MARTFGVNWTSSLGSDNTLSGTPTIGADRTWVGPTGEEYVFTGQPDGSYVSPPGTNATLSIPGSTATLTFHETGNRAEFTPVNSGTRNLTRVYDRNNNQIGVTASGAGSGLSKYHRHPRPRADVRVHIRTARVDHRPDRTAVGVFPRRQHRAPDEL